MSEGGMDRGAGFGDFFGAVYYTGNHASFEGFTAPSDNAIIRLVDTDTDRPGGAD